MASDHYLAADVSGRFVDGVLTERLYLGPPAGPLSQVSACSTEPVLSDEILAYFDWGCDGPAGVRVLGLGSGTPRLLATYTDATSPLSSPVSLDETYGRLRSVLSLSGQMIAYLAGNHIVVRNWQTGQQVQTVAIEAPASDCLTAYTQGPQWSLCGFAVDSDGSLWQLTDTVDVKCDPNAGCPGPSASPVATDYCNGQIDRSPPGGSAHTVATSVCAQLTYSGRPMLVGNGRVIYDRQVAYGPFWLVGTDGTSSLLGDSPNVLGFTGTTATVLRVTCSGAFITTLSLPLSSPIPKNLNESDWSSCRPRVSNLRIRVGQHPKLSVALQCPNGCTGPLVVALNRRPVVASRDFVLAPGGHRHLTIRLGAHSRLVRQATHHRRLRLKLWWVVATDSPKHPLRWVRNAEQLAPIETPVTATARVIP